MKIKDNVHKNHRKRLKETYLKRGIDDFHEHNILELLLFFGIPYKDTNEIAHELINKFGSFSAVFDADVENLKSVKNMTENAAILLKLIPDIARRYEIDKASENENLSSIKDVDNFLLKKYIGATEETVYLILLDSDERIIDCVLLDVGNNVASEINLSKIVKIANKRSVTKVALAHNHPDGTPVSSDDIVATQRAAYCVEKVGIKLVESYVASGDKVYRVLAMIGADKKA